MPFPNITTGVREEVVRLREKYKPEDVSDYQISKMVGVSRQRVHQILACYNSPYAISVGKINKIKYEGRDFYRRKQKAKLAKLRRPSV